MKLLNKFFLAVLSVALLTACEEGTPETTDYDYVGFENASSTVFLKAGESQEVMYKAYANSTSTSDISIMVDESSTLDASYYTVGSVTAEGNELSFTVTFANYDVTMVDGQSVVINLVNPNGYVSAPMSINTTPDCPTLTLTFDNWPEEAAWAITDAGGNGVASGGIAGGAFSGEYAGQTSASISLCQLTAGDYTITVYDQYQDGGTAYRMLVDAGTVEVFSISGGDYTFTTSVDFTIQ